MDWNERQWLIRNPIIWIIVPIVVVAALTPLLLMGDNDAARGDLWALLVLPALFLFHLRTDLDATTIRVTWVPFWRRTIALADIQSAHTEEYRWYRFGGWGIRWRPDATAYTVWGRGAIRLELSDGKRDLVVGTQDPEGLLEALRYAGTATGDAPPRPEPNGR